MASTLRPIPALFAAALLGLAASAARADTASTGQIYQQRGADGSIVLTDRPSPKAVTERTWQIDREDPVAARQRALEVRREAEAVSERVQRSIESQERRASEADFMRLRLAQLDRQQYAPDNNDEGDTVIFAPGGFRPFANRRPPLANGHRGRHHAPRPSMHPSPFRGSGSF